MIKSTPILFWFCLILTTSIALYNISDSTHALSNQLRDLNAQIEAEQTNIHVLKAEWAYLASPAKIQAAAQKHLKMQPTSAKQMASLNDLPDLLPTRNEAMATISVAGTPIASIASLPARTPRGDNANVASNDKHHVNIRMIIQRITASKRSPNEQDRIQLADFGTRP